jgi:RNA recognition motif-containing protein
MKKLFVGGLSFKTTEQGLADAFAKAGPVISAVIITDRMTKRSKGFGFVEMENDADADKAIDMYNNQELDGRQVVVNEARPREEKRF